MDNGVHNAERLKELQALPLERKIQITQTRIMEWVHRWGNKAYVSFSGGKDSTVLLDLARRAFPDIPAIFVNTGLEYPEIQKFVRSVDNVTILRPQMMFTDVITNYGYPLISKEVAEAIYYARRIVPTSKDAAAGQYFTGTEPQTTKIRITGRAPIHSRTQLLGGELLLKSDAERNVRRQLREGFSGVKYDKPITKSIFNKEKWLPTARDIPAQISHMCCSVMKKKPVKEYEKRYGTHPVIGSMTEEGRMRKQAWIRNGCNAFDAKRPLSQPMSFWTEQDVLEYLYTFNIPFCSVYGEIERDSCDKLHCTGCNRTGCIFCAFGIHRTIGETSFQRLSKYHPRQYEYCIGGGQWADNPAYDPTASAEPDKMGWVNWNPKKIWIPSHNGLGMGKVFDMMNEIYGNNFYRYK